MFIGLDYSTSGVVDMQMKSLAKVQITDILNLGSSSSVSNIKTIGSLDLKQLYPIKASKSLRTIYNDDFYSYV